MISPFCFFSFKVFAYLMINGKILTHDVMLRGGFQCESRCRTCNTCRLETLLHLFFKCQYAREVWNHISCLLGYRIIRQGSSFQKIWDWSSAQFQRSSGVQKQNWTAQFIWTCWHLWKNRNANIFRGTQLPAHVLAVRILEENRLWEKYTWWLPFLVLLFHFLLVRK